MTCQPEFLIIGAQKAGTSSLFAFLAEHPELRLPPRKELHYFDVQYQRGRAWYWAQFPEGARSGEATPYYLFHPHAPRRAAETLPRARLVILLRNPVDRAFSHYHMERRLGLEQAPTFEAAIEAEPGRLAPELDRMLADERYYSFVHQTYSYLARGHYVEQLERWLQFFSFEQLLILESEQLFVRPQAGCDAVCDFLGIGRRPAVRLPRENEGTYARMAKATRDQLDAHFLESNQRLSKLLTRKPSWCESTHERDCSQPWSSGP